MRLRDTYAQWSAKNVLSDPRNKCKEVTERMALAFPELERVRGHYVCPIEGRLPHWWMRTPNGQIVDPTRAQFSSKGDGLYEPHVGPEPKGFCLNCGEYVYGDDQFCSRECFDETTAYLEAEGRNSSGE